MSIYSDLLSAVEYGSKFKINLVKKTLMIDGKDIIIEGNLIDNKDFQVNERNPWDIVESLYALYKRSAPTAHHNGNKPYFKADSVEDLTDNEIAFNFDRNLCQAALEGYILLASLSGWLVWQNDSHWFWQGTDKELVVLKEWI